MRQIGNSKVVTARKDYGCDACQFLIDSDPDWSSLTFSEKREVVKAKKNGWRIMKGEKCLTSTLVSCDGKDILTIRELPSIHEINVDYGVYEDAEMC